MDKQLFEQLVRIYNTLTTISTKGEDTIIMATCLTNFRENLMLIQSNLQNISKE